MKIVYIIFALLFLLTSTGGVWAQKGRSSKRLFFKQKKDKKLKDTLVYSGRSQSMSVNLGGRKKNYIIIDWIQPGEGPVTLVNGSLPIKLKIFSPILIHAEDVTVYHNQKLVGSKMDVSGLFGQQNEFNYSNRIP